MIEHPGHLEDLDVKLTHTCDQCHTVHAPLENINFVNALKKARALKEEMSE